MIDLLISLGKMILMLLPFILLSALNNKCNLKREIRYKQFLMPIVAIILCAVAMALINEVYATAYLLLQKIISWIEQLSSWVQTNLPQSMDQISQWITSMLNKLVAWIKGLNLTFWAFYLANTLVLLAYVLVKKILVVLMKVLFKDGNIFMTLAGQFYEYDEVSGQWHLIPKFGQARTFLGTMYIASVVLGVLGVLVSSKLYLKELLTAPYYPVFSVIVLGELYFVLNGLTRKEFKNEVEGEEEESEHLSNYSIMRRVLRQLFPDKLSAENTTISEGAAELTTTDEILAAMEESDNVAEEAYGRFMRVKSDKGMELDRNYLLSGLQLLRSESVLFNNPFYYDLIPYIFYPMHRAMLRRKKVLVILGRHGAEESAEKWCRDGLTAVTNIPTMWNIGVLTEQQQDLDVGIITRSSVHDLKMHEANQEFFDEVEFVVMLEPSRLVTTAQVGLNSIVRHCRRKKKQIVFCSADKNCDGLLDALSHILMTKIREVTATNHHKGASSYMIWDADCEYLQHRLLPNISRYLGMGTELSFAALKNQVPETEWIGGEAFPVEDIHWIAKQYYYDLLHYANLPTTQETMDRLFKVSSDMWGSKASANKYITVEDESFNMFEVKRDYSTRATDQGFVNVICSDYLLKDYMAANDSIFNADPKAIPYITADYARTPRNVVLRLCLRMSTGLVSEQEIVRELKMIDRDGANPVKSFWNEVCRTCGHVGSAQPNADGHMTLCCSDVDRDVVFTADVLICRRRYNVESGMVENMYTITDSRFIRLLLESLKPAEYVAEDENGDHSYLGTELRGHVFQKYLPGQFFTFGGKYYEMLRLTADDQVVVRRASDHIDGRPFYRQVRNYILSQPVDSTVMGECRDMGHIRIHRQFADIRVQTPAYWNMKRYHDFATGKKINLNGIPERVYKNKSIVRIDIAPDEQLPENTISTLTVLINEVLRTLLAENQDYLVAVTGGEAQTPNTYSLSGEDGFVPDEHSIYLIEDSQLDIGLLDAVERNLNRIFNVICDYLHWHEETKTESLTPKPEPVKPAQPEQEEQPKKKGFFGKVGGFFKKIGGFFKKIVGAIGRFFKKVFVGIAAFLKKLFGKKKPEEVPVDEERPLEPETPETEQPVDPRETEAEAETEAEVEVEVEAAPEEEAAEEPKENFDTMYLFDAEERAGDQQGTSGVSDDTVDYEPEEVLKPGVSFQRLPYHQRYYLHYCSDTVEATLNLSAVCRLLDGMGYDNNSLTQARRGKNVAEMVERNFVPNREGSHYCDFCGRELTGLDYDILGDGRERCTNCGRTAVKSVDEFVALHDAVLRNMRVFFGIKINAPVHVQMVNSKRLHKRLGKTFVPTGKADGRVLGVAIKDKNGYTILVENGAPKLQSTMTMVHEMTHIWQYLNWDAKGILKTYGKAENLEIYEGMAKWVEIQYAYLLNETETAKRQEIITRHRDDEYGRGFVKYTDKYPLSIGGGSVGSTPFDNPSRPL